jgi:hypothetical protein
MNSSGAAQFGQNLNSWAMAGQAGKTPVDR